MTADRDYRLRSRGFSVVELLVVSAIIVSITALALPSIMDVVASSRLRSSVGGLAGLLQECRSRAIKQNKVTAVHFDTAQGRPVAYIKVAIDSSARNEHDPQEWFASGFQKATAPTGGPSVLDPNIMWNGMGTDPLKTEDASFNPRGLPCLYHSDTGVCDSSVGFVYYFSYNWPLTHVRWAALGISPAGRVKTWYWNGTNWAD